MENVMVVGAGFMGAGIAQVCAQSGYRVFLMDANPDNMEKALGNITWSVEKFASKGFLKEAPGTILERISLERDLEKASRVQWCIEAVYEDEKLKLKLFEDLDHRVPADTPLSSNTSSIPISRLARITQNPARVPGLHFFGPVVCWSGYRIADASRFPIRTDCLVKFGKCRPQVTDGQ